MKIKWQGENVELLSVLYELVLDVNIQDDVRIILLKAKQNLENGHFDRQVIRDLKNDLRIFALKGELTNETTAFLLEISRKTGSNTTGGSLFDTLIP